MKEYKYLIMLLAFIFIPNIVNAEADYVITQSDFEQSYTTGQKVKGIYYQDDMFYLDGNFEYKLGSDIDLYDYGRKINIYADKVKLDLKGHSMSSVFFDINTTLEVSGNGNVSNSEGNIFGVYSGILTINNGTFYSDTDCIELEGDSTLTINGGHFSSEYNCIRLEVQETDGSELYTNTNIIINGGTFEGKESALRVLHANNVEINGGTFKGLFGAYFEDYNSLTINEGTFIGGLYGVLFKMSNGGSGYSYNNFLSGGSFKGVYDDKYSEYYELETYSDLSSGAYAVVVEGEYIDASLDMLIESIANSLNNALTENHTFENELDFSSQIKYSGGNPIGEHCEGVWIEDGYDDEGAWVDTSYCDGEMVTDYDYEDSDILTYVYMPSDNLVISTGESNNTYTITTSVTNGDITATSEVNVGEDFTVNYSPNEGYILETVEIDGVSVSIEDYYDSYTFENVMDNHTISVVFIEESNNNPDEPNEEEYRITIYFSEGNIPDAVEDGYIAFGEGGNESYYIDIPGGTNFTVNYVPTRDAMTLKSLKVDGVLVDRETYASSYTFSNVTSNHTINVVYANDLNENGIPDDEEELDEPDECIELTQEDFDEAYANPFKTVKGVIYDETESFSLNEGNYRLASNITLDNEHIDIYSDVTIDLNDHNISSSDEYAFYARNNSILTMDGAGTVTGSTAAIAVAGGSIVINGGTYVGAGIGIGVALATSIVINDGTFQGAIGGIGFFYATAISNNISISGGTFRSLLNNYGAFGFVGDLSEDAFVGKINNIIADGYTFNEKLIYDQTENDNYGIITHSQKELSVVPSNDEEEYYEIRVYLENGYIPNEENYELYGDDEGEYYYTSVIGGEDFIVEYVPIDDEFENYTIKSITVDNNTVDRDTYSSSYTFENVTSDHTISVEYALDNNENGIPDEEEHLIITSVRFGYFIGEFYNEVWGDADFIDYYTLVPNGGDFTVQCVPREDEYASFIIKSVRVDGVLVDRDIYSSGYTFENVTSDHTIEIEYADDSNDNGIPDDEEEAHSITTSITNGYITESQDVEYDGTFEVYYFPSQGYLIDSVTIDRVVVNSETYSSGYTFENVTSDHTIEVICTEYDAGDEVIEITQEDFDTAFENTVCVYDVNSFEYCGSNSVNGVSYYNIDGDSYYYLATGSYRLGSNITMSDGEGISIDSEVNINLNNHNISGGLAGIVSYGTTTIEGSGSISGAIAGVGVSGGSIVINGGTIEGALAGLAITGTPENITLNGGTYRALLNDYGAIGILEDIDSETFIEGINSFLTEGYTFNEEVTYAQTDNDSFGLVTHTQQELLVIPAPETYTITTNVTNGNITQSTEVDEGSNFTVEYSASNGYALKSITVDNNVVNRETYSTSYTFSNVTSDHTISVVYALDENNNNIPDEEETFLVTTSVTNGNITESTEVTYGNNLTVTYSANSGYILKSVTVDGEEVSIETYSNSYTFTNVTSTHTINVVYEEESNTDPEEDNYEIIEGDNQKFKDEDIVITCNGDYNLFVKLLVDGEEVDEENYTVESGSTIVTLKKSYLDTLGSGKHTVTFVYQDGQASATLNIPMTNVPKTLDNIYSYILLLIVSFVMIIIGRKIIKNN